MDPFPHPRLVKWLVGKWTTHNEVSLRIHKDTIEMDNISCRSIRGPEMPLLSGDVAQHNSRYRHSSSMLTHEKDLTSSKSGNNSSKKRCTLFLDASSKLTSSPSIYAWQSYGRLFSCIWWRSTYKLPRSHRVRKPVPSRALYLAMNPTVHETLLTHSALHDSWQDDLQQNDYIL